MSKRVFQWSCIMLMLSLPCTTYAVVIGDFEGNMDGWGQTWEKDCNFAFSSTGVTSGSQSLAVKLNTGGYWALQYVAPAVPKLVPGVKLRFDLTMIQSEWTGNNWTKVADKIAINSDGLSGWKEYFPTATDRVTGAAVADDWGPWNPDALKTYSVDISDYNATGATWFQINIALQQNPVDGAGNFYIDNVQLLGIKPGPFFLDTFATAHDYITEDLGAYDGILDGNNIEALNASVSRAGALYMQTANGAWEPGPGPLLYKQITGDFVATVKVVDFAGTIDASVYSNDSGIMARDPNGAQENWVSVNYFPTWTAFVARNTHGGVRDELGQTAARWAGVDTYAIAKPYPYLQLERRGSNFYPRISSDGVKFIPLTDPAYMGIYDPNDPNQKPLVISRTDLPATLQIGLLSATYSADSGYVAFDDFQIDVALPIKLVNPSFEADGMVIQGGTPKDWTGNLPGNSGVATGTSATDGTYFFWQGNGSVVDQNTTEIVTAEGMTYVLKADVRNSWQGSPKISLYYEDAGTRVELGSASLPANGDTWPAPVTMEAVVKTTAASVGKKLGVELSLANYPGNYWSEFDNIRLSVMK